MIIIPLFLIAVASASSFGSLQFDATTTETFIDGTEVDIGWIKFSSCEEGYGATSAAQYGTHSLTELINLAKHAVTVKIINDEGISGPTHPGLGEDDDFALQTNICSAPIFALNNGYELSFAIDMDENDGTASVIGTTDVNSDWMGTESARNRLQNAACNYAAPRMLEDGIFFDSCNDGGLFITTKPIPFPFVGSIDVCAWEMTPFGVSDQGKDISIWIGFDQTQQHCCKLKNGVFQYNYCGPTSEPTVDPTAVPTLQPTTNPTGWPTLPPVNYVDVSCFAGQLTRPNSCDIWTSSPGSSLTGGNYQMIACGFIDYAGGKAQEVYIDTDNENKCTVDSVTEQDALNIAHCCDIPPDVGFSCRYPSSHQIGSIVSTVECAVNEVAIGCQSVSSTCIGYDDCSELIAAADGNWRPPIIEPDQQWMKNDRYYVEDIDNHYCTSHQQYFNNGYINVQASCCSVASGYSLECKQVVGPLDNYHFSYIYCNKVLGEGWFVTGCGAYVTNEKELDDGAYIAEIRPESNRCFVEAGRPEAPENDGFYPIAQCCRIIEE